MRGLNSSVRGCLSKLLCVYFHAQCVIVGRSDTARRYIFWLLDSKSSYLLPFEYEFCRELMRSLAYVSLYGIRFLIWHITHLAGSIVVVRVNRTRTYTDSTLHAGARCVIFTCVRQCGDMFLPHTYIPST